MWCFIYLISNFGFKKYFLVCGITTHVHHNLHLFLASNSLFLLSFCNFQTLLSGQAVWPTATSCWPWHEPWTCLYLLLCHHGEENPNADMGGGLHVSLFPAYDGNTSAYYLELMCVEHMPCVYIAAFWLYHRTYFQYNLLTKVHSSTCFSVSPFHFTNT